MKASKRFSKVDIYKIVLIVVTHPDGGYGGETFWGTMLMKYGSPFFGGKAAAGLRAKWRHIAKEHERDLGTYIKELETDLGSELVRDIKDEVEGVVPIRSKEKKLDTDEKSGKKRQEKKDGPGLIEAIKRRMKERVHYIPRENEAEKEAEEKGNPPAIVGHFDSQGIDLNKLKKLNKNKEVETNARELDRANEKGDELEEIILSRLTEAKKILFMKDLATLQYEIKDEKEEKEEVKEQFVDLDKKLTTLSEKYGVSYQMLGKYFAQTGGDFVELEKHLKGENAILWSEEEDLILKHPENAALYRELEKKKGKENIAKRKEYLTLK